MDDAWGTLMSITGLGQMSAKRIQGRTRVSERQTTPLSTKDLGVNACCIDYFLNGHKRYWF